MRSANLKHAVALAIAQAQQACDPRQNALMDRTDLEETIARLKHLLEELSSACDDLECSVGTLSDTPLLVDQLDGYRIHPSHANQ